MNNTKAYNPRWQRMKPQSKWSKDFQMVGYILLSVCAFISLLICITCLAIKKVEIYNRRVEERERLTAQSRSEVNVEMFKKDVSEQARSGRDSGGFDHKTAYSAFASHKSPPGEQASSDQYDFSRGNFSNSSQQKISSVLM